MLLLSGYTLGFFFPKQAARLDLNPSTIAESDRRRPDETRPDRALRTDDSERPEIPAAHYFYRYF